MAQELVTYYVDGDRKNSDPGNTLRLPEVFVRYIRGVMGQERRVWSRGEVERAYCRYVDRQNTLAVRVCEARGKGDTQDAATALMELVGEVRLADGRWRQCQDRRVARAERKRRNRQLKIS